MTREEAIINLKLSQNRIGGMKKEEWNALQMAIEALSAETIQGWRTDKPTEQGEYMVTLDAWGHRYINIMHYDKPQIPNREVGGVCWYRSDDEWGDVVYDDADILAWMPLPKPYRESEVKE